MALHEPQEMGIDPGALPALDAQHEWVVESGDTGGLFANDELSMAIHQRPRWAEHLHAERFGTQIACQPLAEDPEKGLHDAAREAAQRLVDDLGGQQERPRHRKKHPRHAVSAPVPAPTTDDPARQDRRRHLGRALYVLGWSVWFLCLAMALVAAMNGNTVPLIFLGTMGIVMAWYWVYTRDDT